MDVGQSPHFVEKKPAVSGRFHKPSACSCHLHGQVNHGPLGSKPALGYHDPLRAALCYLVDDVLTWQHGGIKFAGVMAGHRQDIP